MSDETDDVRRMSDRELVDYARLMREQISANIGAQPITQPLEKAEALARQYLCIRRMIKTVDLEPHTESLREFYRDDRELDPTGETLTWTEERAEYLEQFRGDLSEVVKSLHDSNRT